MSAQVRKGRERSKSLQPGTSSESSSIQQSLTGDEAQIGNDNGEQIETNRSKANNDLDEESGYVPGQLRLDFFGSGQTTIEEWIAVLGERDAAV